MESKEGVQATFQSVLNEDKKISFAFEDLFNNMNAAEKSVYKKRTDVKNDDVLKQLLENELGLSDDTLKLITINGVDYFQSESYDTLTIMHFENGYGYSFVLNATQDEIYSEDLEKMLESATINTQALMEKEADAKQGILFVFFALLLVFAGLVVGVIVIAKKRKPIVVEPYAVRSDAGVTPQFHSGISLEEEERT